MEILKFHDVKSYLEIGARHGDTFHTVVKSLGCRGLAVDLPGGPWGSRSKEALEKVVDELNADLILGDSCEVVEQVKSLGPFDAVLIDGDHRYQAVKRDFYNYMCPITALHDIDGRGLVCGPYKMGVPEFWDEIKVNYKHEEIIDPSDDRPMGIGVIFNGNHLCD